MKVSTSFILMSLTLSMTTFGQAPVVSSFSPESGPIGTTVIITGSGFNTTPAMNDVVFGSTRATVTAASATSLTVTVPVGAMYKPFWVTNLANNLSGYSLKPFMVTQPGGITYSAKQTYTMDDPYVQPYVVGLGDFDNDGNSDLAVTSGSTFGMAILRNNGTPGTISFEASTLLGTGNMTVFDVADIDGDGKSDIVVPNVGAAMNFFRNTTTTGAISFSASTGASDGNCFSLVINDLDGDGKPDYAASFAGDGFVVYRNGSSPGNISFTLAHKIRPNNNFDGIQRVAVGDLDGDGKSDLVALNITSQVIHVYRNISTPGSITFASRVDFPMTGANLRAVFLGDLDGDGKADLAITNQATFRVSVYRNTSILGAIGFAPVVEFPTFIGPRFITEGDLDGDGKPDLVIGTNLHGSDKLAVIRNTSTTGTMSFETPLALAADLIPSFAAIGDLDGDHKPDIVTANGSVGTSSLSFFRQLTPVVVSSFSPSSGCAGTGTVVITGSGFTRASRVTIGGADVLNFTVDSPTQITATVGNGPSGVIEVTADYTNASAATFTVNTIPSQPATIAGDASVCAGSMETYAITPVSGATGYIWTLPSGWTGISTTNSIDVTANSTGGTISVIASNACGSSPAQTLSATVNSIPAQPASVTGDAVVCPGDSKAYNVASVNGATSYTWILPSGWTGTSNTPSINVLVSATSGDIAVTADNDCGSSMAQTLAIAVNSIPAQPAGISGDPILCAHDTETYNIASVSGATSYSWTLPSGWTGTSPSNSIDITASANSGDVSVIASNTCGSSPAQTLAVTVNSIPAQPGVIIGSATLCANDSETYSVTSVSGATSYSWALPSGWTGTSPSNSIDITARAHGGDVSVIASNACGSSLTQTLAVTVNSIPPQPGVIIGSATLCADDSETYSVTSVSGATSYSWALPSGWTGTSPSNSIDITASATSGDVSVTASNTCGSSPAQTLAVTVNSKPAQPGVIDGTAILCADVSETYSVVSVSGATSYSWVLPSGWTGTSPTNSIDVTASANSGDVSVIANNTCGSSPAQTLAVTVNSKPAQPGVIGGDVVVCAGNAKTYSIIPVNGTATYAWTLPSGWTGSSARHSIDVTVNATGGNISVTANNICGSSPARTLNVTVNVMPGQPGTIAGSTTLCSGEGERYSVTTVAGATGYTWTFPDGWAGQSTTNVTDIIAGIQGGEVSVKANNSCGSSPAQIQVVNIITVPTPIVEIRESDEGYTLSSDSDHGNQWFLDGEAIVGANQKEYFAATTGVYNVQTTTGSCSSDLSEGVEINTRIWLAFLPTLFTPNGNGMNEGFRVRAAGIEEIQFSVYDVSGREVYHTTNVAEATGTGWDGKYKGNDLPDGTYTWALRGKYVNGESLTNSKNQYGQVVMMR